MLWSKIRRKKRGTVPRCEFFALQSEGSYMASLLRRCNDRPNVKIFIYRDLTRRILFPVPSWYTSSNPIISILTQGCMELLQLLWRAFLLSFFSSFFHTAIVIARNYYLPKGHRPSFLPSPTPPISYPDPFSWPPHPPLTTLLSFSYPQLRSSRIFNRRTTFAIFPPCSDPSFSLSCAKHKTSGKIEADPREKRSTIL